MLGRSEYTGDSKADRSRIRSLETQVTSIQNTLTELVQTLRAGSSAASNGSGRTPGNVSTTPDFPAHSNLVASPSHHSTPGPYSGNRPPPMASLHSLLSRSSSDTINPYATSIPQSEQNFRRPAPPTDNAWQSLPPPGADPNAKGLHTSLPPSRAASEGAEEFAPEDIINPLGAMSNMAGLVEAAVERAREEKELSTTGKRSSVEEDEPSNKRARWSFASSADGPAVVEAQPLPQSISPAKSKRNLKRTHIHAYPDVIDAGLVPEAEARELLDIYYSGSNNFLPCYDPSFDTWESLKIRSPFSLTTLIMVGARVRDGGGPMSETQRHCRDHSQLVTKNTMFNPVARIEAVQAVVTLGAFSDNAWLPGGHAVRMALDMGINRSFIRLLRSGMGKGKTPEELEEERPLVVHARVWFCVSTYKKGGADDSCT